MAPKLNPPAAGAAADDPPKEKAMVMRWACREGRVVLKKVKMRAKREGREEVAKQHVIGRRH